MTCSAAPGARSTLLLLALLFTHLCLHGAAAATTRQRQRRIGNVVVLVMENRSFDHMLGWMKKWVNPGVDGLDGTECNRRRTSDPKSPVVCVSDDAQLVDPDPGHSYEDIKRQVFGSSSVPDMSGFVQQATGTGTDPDLSGAVMRGFKPSHVPIYATLAQEFAVFDRWFASLPASTQPNRLFVYSATSHGIVGNDKPKLLRGFPQKTIFDSFHEDGLDFGIYSQTIPATLFFRNLRRLKYVSNKFHAFDTFFDHAGRGELRELSVLEPRYFDVVGKPANDDHPSHDVGNGQKLVKQVYEALRGSPQWNQTLLVVTYDEHGGFFDHVPTPYRGVPSPDAIAGPAPEFFGFDRLGVRVPTIMISPWINRGTVVRRPTGPTPTSEYEHSSIPATLKKLFNLSSDHLTSRDAWAGTFEHILAGRTSPRTDCPEVLPNPTPLRSTPEANESKTVTEFQSELVQLAAAVGGGGDVSLMSDWHSHAFSGRMTVKQADEYVSRAMARFYRSAEEAMRSGVDESTVLNVMRSNP